jgi:hypothetical protein
MKNVPVIAALAMLLGACARPAPSTEPAAPSATAEKVEAETCAFAEVTVGHPACNVSLAADGSVGIDGRPYPPIIVSRQEGAGGTLEIPARRLVVFPSGLGSRARIIQACEDAQPNGLCWAVRLADPAREDLRVIPAGKYGPEHWIRWSPQGARAALLSTTEGFDWLHVIDAASGATMTFPTPDENANWRIDRDSFAWEGDDRFRVSVTACESCAPEERSFNLP